MIHSVASNEECRCASIRCLYLVYTLSENPVCCGDCRGEVSLERLSLSSDELESLRNCFNVFGSLYKLWLDSGEYEEYAKERLLDSSGQVNLHGMRLAKKISSHILVYYWWFWDSEDGVPDRCPSCQGNLDYNITWAEGKCDCCHIVI